jgi:hypothetical protein
MSYRKTNEANMYRRLRELGVLHEQILEFLVLERLIPSEEVKRISQLSVTLRGRELYDLVESLRSNPIVQMIDYEWSLLPSERIKITIVTDHSSKEFYYSETGGM